MISPVRHCAGHLGYHSQWKQLWPLLHIAFYKSEDTESHEKYLLNTCEIQLLIYGREKCHSALSVKNGREKI